MNADDWLDRSRRSLRTAEQVLPDDPDSACNRAYYAMFYAARAALLAAGRPEAAMGPVLTRCSPNAAISRSRFCSVVQRSIPSGTG